MKVSELFGKRTWSGLLLSVVALLLCIMVGALLIVRGVLPPVVQMPWVCGSCAVAALLGGLVAGKGRGDPLARLMVAALLLGLMWIAALGSGAPITFGSDGLWITGCVLGGGLLACLFRGGRKKRGKRMARGAVQRRKRTVT